MSRSRTKFSGLFASVFCVAALGDAAVPASVRAAEAVSYNQDIRPILVENCLGCHGADSAHRAADLRLDVRDDAVESGSIVPGDPDSSVMLDRIFSDDPDEVKRSRSADGTRRFTALAQPISRGWLAPNCEPSCIASVIAASTVG